MSWGTKIALLYSGFVVLIVTLVCATFYHQSDLVANDYYAQEISFQKRLDATNAANSLKEPLSVRVEGERIVLQFPATFSSKELTGNVHFYAAANAGADRSFPINKLSGCNWSIERDKLANASYEMQVSWAISGNDYYQAMPLPLRNR